MMASTVKWFTAGSDKETELGVSDMGTKHVEAVGRFHYTV